MFFKRVNVNIVEYDAYSLLYLNSLENVNVMQCNSRFFFLNNAFHLYKCNKGNLTGGLQSKCAVHPHLNDSFLVGGNMSAKMLKIIYLITIIKSYDCKCQ